MLSLDVSVDHIQDIISDLQIQGKGYGFVVNNDGMIIVHQDNTLEGTFLNEDASGRAMMDRILETGNGSFEISADGGTSTAFVHQIQGQWYAVIVVSNQELYATVWQQLAVNVLISLVIFALITFFYRLGVKDIWLDPGFGFGKTLEENHELLDRLDELTTLFREPLLAGLSRKRMIYQRLDCAPDEALHGTVALDAIALHLGAAIVRVHDVKPAVETVKLLYRNTL